MLRRTVLIIALLSSLFHVTFTLAQTNQPTAKRAAPVKGRAETVFGSSAQKVVFLITRQRGEVYATASGVILSADGYIGTNYHALQGAETVEVRYFSDPADSDYVSFDSVRLLYANPEYDIAILKIGYEARQIADPDARGADIDQFMAISNGLPFFVCPRENDCRARIGEDVWAIGNPKGLSNTISEGIVSALRSDNEEEIIQHTAPISHGSSGGALVDEKGNLLGMNSWGVVDAQNLNFAISAKHIFEALSVARSATAELAFPPEAVAATASATEDRAWQAFQSRDYIQAANQAEQVVATATSDSKIYMILGKADIELGKKQEAERYLRQALLLAGSDDKFKQSSRYYLLTILTAKFNPATTSVERLALIRLVQDFLDSKAGSVDDGEFYQRTREWAASIPPHVRSIVGSWWEDPPYTLLNGPCGTDYEISVSSSGEFRIFPGFRSGDIKFVPHPTLCKLDGKLAPNGNGFSGNVTRGVLPDPYSYGIGMAEQDLGIYLEMSDDLQTIVGVATGGTIRSGGESGKYAMSLLKIPSDIPPGSKKFWRFTLHRAQ